MLCCVVSRVGVIRERRKKRTKGGPSVRRTSKERKMTGTHVHTGTWYLALCVIPGAVCSKERSAQPSTAHRRIAGQ